MKSVAAPVKVKPRAVKKRVAPKRKIAAASAISLSSPTISKKKVWKNSFAPKRTAWYELLYARQIDTHTGISAIVVVSVFLFGIVFSIHKIDSAPIKSLATSYHTELSTEDGPLQQNMNYVIRLLHVPGAFVDTSDSPPEITKPLGPINDQTLTEAIALLPLFKESFVETTALAFDASFGAAARIFVGSVHEMGDMANKTIAEEFNLAAVVGALKGAAISQ
jgi:hypothetical protein